MHHEEVLELQSVVRVPSILMGVIQCVGSMLLSLVGLVYGCVVLILENQESLAPSVFRNVIASVSDHFNSMWMSQEG